MKRILVMGLPGSGKTTLSQNLVTRLMLTHSVSWFNADSVREQHNDWDFSPEGRIRQMQRMIDLSKNSGSDFTICDFVCPTDDLRKSFDADVVIWMDTITEGRFEDTNKMFEKPSSVTYRVTDWADSWVKSIAFDLTQEKSDTHTRSIVKAISWRTIGTIDTFILSWFITGEIKLAAAIGGSEVITKMVLYWLHERGWNKIKWGKR
jgi:adenylylsulfate kinase